MNIIITTAQVPFVRGGNEELVDSLKLALQERGHRVDVVALPFKWYPRESLVRSMAAWRLLDLTEANGVPVDLVIATKFPSYLVQHPNKRLWLVHQYRQAYDWYGTPFSDLTGQPEDVRLRQMVQEADARGIGEIAPQHRYAISQNVAGRLKKYNGLDAAALYPPPKPIWRPGNYGDYILYLNRLDDAKRPLLLLDALQLVPDAKAIIAGSGPLLEEVKKRAAKLGDRVQVLGRVSDEAAVELYANARAVFYAPVDEDYGYSTLEAQASAKAVITTTDAGGVLEFATHERNALVTEPTAAAVAESIRQLADAALAERLGRQGQADLEARGIGWDGVVGRLLV